MESKNKKLLDEFVAYCEEHPEQRFWQAARNWSGATRIMYELDYYLDYKDSHQSSSRDTFYWEGKDE